MSFSWRVIISKFCGFSKIWGSVDFLVNILKKYKIFASIIHRESIMNIKIGTLFLLVTVSTLVACEEASQEAEKKAYNKAFTDCRILLEKQFGVFSIKIPYVKDHGSTGGHYFIWNGDSKIQYTSTAGGKVTSAFATCRHDGAAAMSITISTESVTSNSR